MDWNRADRIVDPEPLEKLKAEHHKNARDAPQKNCAGWTDPIAGTSDGHKTRQEAVRRKAGVPFLAGHISPEHGGQSRRACSESCVGSDSANAFKIHRRERAARIETVPAEPQDQSASDSDR